MTWAKSEINCVNTEIHSSNTYSFIIYRITNLCVFPPPPPPPQKNERKDYIFQFINTLYNYVTIPLLFSNVLSTCFLVL